MIIVSGIGRSVGRSVGLNFIVNADVVVVAEFSCLLLLFYRFQLSLNLIVAAGSFVCLSCSLTLGL